MANFITLDIIGGNNFTQGPCIINTNQVIGVEQEVVGEIDIYLNTVSPGERIIVKLSTSTSSLTPPVLSSNNSVINGFNNALSATPGYNKSKVILGRDDNGDRIFVWSVEYRTGRWITDRNFKTLVDETLALDPINGNVDLGYGVMSAWDVSRVTDMNNAFSGKLSFNGDISSWNTSNVTNFSGMFNSSQSFNQNISSWNVSSGTNFESMFNTAIGFTQNINAWNVSSALNMGAMFSATPYNQDLSSWDVSNVTSMALMFYNASSYNQDLSSWDVSSVTSSFFFDQGASSWTLPKPNFS